MIYCVKRPPNELVLGPSVERSTMPRPPKQVAAGPYWDGNFPRTHGITVMLSFLLCRALTAWMVRG